MGSRHDNKYYGQLSDITDNLAEAMGMKGNADSNYMTNLNKMAILEGNTMDNRKKQGLWDALQSSTGQEGLSLDQILMRHLGKNSTDFQGGLEGETLLPGKEKLQQQKIDSGALKRSLEDALAYNNKPVDPRAFETGDAWVKDFASKQQGANDQAFSRNMRTLLALNNNQPGVNLDPTGSRGAASDILSKMESLAEVEKKGSYTDWNKERKKYVGILGEINVKLVEGKIDSLKTLTDERKKDIRNKILDRIARLDQEILTSKKGRKKLDAEIDVMVEKLLTQEEKTENEWYRGENIQTDTELTEANIEVSEEKKEGEEHSTKKKEYQKKGEKLKFDALPDDLKADLEIKKKQVEKLDADISKIKQLERTALTIELLNRAKRLRTHNLQEIDKILLPYKKNNLEDQNRKFNAEIASLLKKMKSPTQVALGDTHKKVQIEKIKGSGGKGPYDPSATRTPREEESSNTGGKKKKTGWEDPVATGIFNKLMTTVDPQVLTTWTEEETSAAVASIQQELKNKGIDGFSEGRIRNLIQTAQRRNGKRRLK